MKGAGAQDDPIGKWRSDNATHQIAENLGKDMAAKLAAKLPQKSREQIVTERADALVAECILRFLRMRDIAVVPTTRAEAVRLVHHLLIDEFKKWTKEELLILVAFQNAIISTEQLHDNLI